MCSVIWRAYYGARHGVGFVSRSAGNFGRFKNAARKEPVVVTQYGKPAVVILDAAEFERLKNLDRRVLRLDQMSDAEIDEMLLAEIPPEHRYSLADIPD